MNAFRLFAAVAAFSAMTGIAAAGVEPTRDHLQCYKVTDPSRFYAILAMNIGFEAETVGLADTSGCKAKIRSAEICVPAAKTVTETDATILPVAGQNLVNGFLCYKMKCPAADPVTFPASDQFGSRSVTVGKVTTVCAPVDY